MTQGSVRSFSHHRSIPRNASGITSLQGNKYWPTVHLTKKTSPGGCGVMLSAGEGGGWTGWRAAVCDGRAFHFWNVFGKLYLSDAENWIDWILYIYWGEAGVCDGRGGHLRITQGCKKFQRQHVRNTPLVSLEKYMWPNLRNTGFGVVGGGREFAMGGGRLSSGPRGTKGERSAVPPLSTSHPRKWNLPPNTQDTQDIQDTSCYRPLTVNRDKYTIPNTKYTIINSKYGKNVCTPPHRFYLHKMRLV